MMHLESEEDMKIDNEKEGIFFASISYILWGLTPIYWKLIQNVSAEEILAQRIFWSFIFMMILLIIMKKWSTYIHFVKGIIKEPTLFFALFFAAILISSNWGIFMWAVLNNQILEASLGQYMNPLTSILIGVIFLKEKLTRLQKYAFLLASCGFLTMTIYYQVVPWIPLSLALTFGFYGLLKKRIQADSTIGLALETMVIAPIAMIYLLWIVTTSQLQFFTSISTVALLIGSGVITAVPLLLFTKGAKKVSLSLLGILQYISPTLSLLTAVFLYDEVLTIAHLITFIFIWCAILLYMLPTLKKISTSRKITFENSK